MVFCSHHEASIAKTERVSLPRHDLSPRLGLVQFGAIPTVYLAGGA